MDDVKQPIASEASASPATPQSSEVISSPEPTAPAAAPEATPPTPSVEETTVSAQEHENLKTALKQERDKFRKLRRGRTNKSSVQPTPPSTQEAYIKQLETKVAMGELKSGAKKILKDYDVPESLKRAILRNPRGYIKPNTQDVENGLLDIEDYIESEMELLSESQTSQTPPKKDVHVAGTNTPDTNIGATPAEIQAIMDKPVREWSPEDRKALKDYRESHK